MRGCAFSVRSTGVVNRKSHDPQEKIRVLREKLGLSQRVFAQRLRVSEGYLSQIESGKKEVDEGTPLGALFEIMEKGEPAPVQIQHQSSILREEPSEKVRYRAALNEIDDLSRLVGLLLRGRSASEVAEVTEEVISSGVREPLREKVISVLIRELRGRLKTKEKI
jgi:transcriptional regulator with XRE-family HTH domain